MIRWNSLSIRQQLILLITLLLVTVQGFTFVMVNWFDQQDRETLAVEQAHTVSRALHHDFLNLLLNPSSSDSPEINFKLSGFHQVDGVKLINLKGEKVYSYTQADYNENEFVLPPSPNKPFITKGHIVLQLPIESDGYTFGQLLTVIDPEQYQTQIEERFFTLIWLFPIEVIIGFFLAWRLSKRFTQPFTTLAQAMQSNDIKNNVFKRITTQADNEVKHLFAGYNKMISQIERTTEEMRFQSTHDSLTGLLNRYGFESALDRALHNDQHLNSVLLKIDLDQFKLINDTAGVEAGDSLLKLVAHHLYQNLPEDAQIARIDADEFAILLQQYSEKEAKVLAKDLIGTLKDFRFFWEGVPMSTSASCGIVAFSPYEYTQTEIVKAVDSAFSVAKSKGRNKLHIYSPDDLHSQRFSLNTKLVAQVKDALANGASRFELFAQKIEPLQHTTDFVNYEILLRMRDQEGNLVPPDHFLPTADHYNLMADIDSYVLWTYLETVTKHPQHIAQLGKAHVNLSGSSLNHADFQKSLKRAIRTFDFPWNKLELEVTETSAVGNLSKAASFINYFRSVGIGFALDDFGTGMSSFDYLKNLPFDTIKIDGSFVKDMHTDAVDKAVIRYIQEICDLKGLRSVAEYIEREEDVVVLREIGISCGQGYYLGKPKPLAEWLQPDEST